MSSAKVKNRVFDVIFAIILSYSFVYALESSLQLNFPKTYLLFIITALFIIFSTVFINRTSRIISAIITGTGIFSVFIYLLASKLFSKLFTFIDDYFYWLSEYINFPHQHLPFYTFLTELFLCILTSLLVYIFAVRRFNFPVLLVTGAAIFSIQWMYDFTSTLKPFYIFVFMLVLYYLKYILYKKSIRSVNDYVDYSTFILCMLPVCIITVIASYAIKSSNKPIEWKWLDTKVAKVFEYFDNRFDYRVFDYFSFASSGFSQNDGSLGGRARLNNTPVLSVKASKRVYLKGACKDIYTGSSWVESNIGVLEPIYSIENINKNFLDSVAINLFDNNTFSAIPEFISRDKLTIKFDRLKTRTIFVPLYYSAVYEDDTYKTLMKDLLSNENASLSLKTRKEKGFSYSLLAVNFDYSNENFVSALKRCSKGVLKSLLENSPGTSSEAPIQIKTPEGNAITYSINDFVKASEAVRTKYLQLPDKLPQRVRDLALSITEKYKNDYDKAKAIENFLSSNFPYTLETRSLPRNRDFVDYFLFDQRKGYCTYYASAMAVMARCAGIPSRYVEGYTLPPEPDKNGYYIVTNKNAHAWVEIYLEGFGWITFEPTAAYISSFYTGNKAASSQSDSSAFYHEYDEYNKMLEKYRTQGDWDVDIPDFQNSAKDKSSSKPFIIAVIIIAILVFAFVVVNVLNIIRHRLKIINIEGLSPRESVLAAYEYYMEVLRMQKLGISSGETPFTYARRIDYNFLFHNTSFKKISNIFTKARYSKLEITSTEKKEVYDFHFDLLQETKKNVGKFKFYFLRNILGRL